jgi:hypothetical protein
LRLSPREGKVLPARVEGVEVVGREPADLFVEAPCRLEVAEHSPDEVAKSTVETILYAILSSRFGVKYLPMACWTTHHLEPTLACSSYIF